MGRILVFFVPPLMRVSKELFQPPVNPFGQGQHFPQLLPALREFPRLFRHDGQILPDRGKIRLPIRLRRIQLFQIPLELRLDLTALSDLLHMLPPRQVYFCMPLL